MHLCDKNKGLIVTVDAMKAHTRSGGIAPNILNLSTRWGEFFNTRSYSRSCHYYYYYYHHH
jgi:hypothetical protein